MNKSFRPRTKPKLKNKLPQVRLKRAWRHYPIGAVIQPPGTLRSVLVRQGIGEVVEEAVEAVPVVEAAKEDQQEPQKKRRGRPPKVESADDGEVSK